MLSGRQGELVDARERSRLHLLFLEIERRNALRNMRHTSDRRKRKRTEHTVSKTSENSKHRHEIPHRKLPDDNEDTTTVKLSKKIELRADDDGGDHRLPQTHALDSKLKRVNLVVSPNATCEMWQGCDQIDR